MTSTNKGLLIVVLVVATGLGAAAFGIRQLYRSDLYKVADTFVRQDPQVVGTVGEIISTRFGTSGFNVHTGGGGGRAQFELKVEGEKGDGKVYFELCKRGVWEVRFARMVLPGNEYLDLAARGCSSNNAEVRADCVAAQPADAAEVSAAGEHCVDPQDQLVRQSPG